MNLENDEIAPNLEDIGDDQVEGVMGELQTTGAAITEAKTKEEEAKQRVLKLSDKLSTILQNREKLKEAADQIPPDLGEDTGQRFQLTQLDAEIQECEAELVIARREKDALAARMTTAHKAYDAALLSAGELAEALLHSRSTSQTAAIENVAYAFGEPELVEQPTEKIREWLRDNARRDDRSPDLEDKICGLLDHISAKRVAEEQDAANYNERTRKIFERTAERARRMSEDRVEKLVAVVVELQESFAETAETRRELLNKISAAKGPDPDGALERKIKRCRQLIEEEEGRNQEAAQSKLDELGLRQSNLERLSKKVLSANHIDLVIGEASIVSSELEQHRFVRTWPLIVALATSAIYLLLLSFDETLFLPSQRKGIVAFAFVVSLAFSLKFGMVRRRQFMRGLRNRLRAMIEEVINDRDFVHKERFRFRSVAPENSGEQGVARPHAAKNRSLLGKTATALVTFGPLQTVSRVLHNLFSKKEIALESSVLERSRGRRTGVMVAKNIFMMLGPAALLFFISQYGMQMQLPNALRSVVNSDRSTSIVITKLGTECLQGSGRLVRETDSAVYVHPKSKIETWNDLIAPATGATMIERVDSMQVIPVTEPLALPKCADVQPIDWSSNVAAGLALASETLAASIDTFEPVMMPSTIVHVDASESARLEERTQTDDPANKSAFWLSRWVNRLRTIALTNFRIVVVQPKNQPVFTSTLILQDGTSTTHRNAMVLPFFPNPITKTGNTIQDAFTAGRTRSRKTTTVETEKATKSGAKYNVRQDYFDIIVETIERRVTEGGIVAIDVMGFATSTWRHEEDREKKETLNHALAEGRRVSVLKELKDGLSGNGMSDRIWLIDNDKSEVCFSSWKPADRRENNSDRFEDYDEMVAVLETWVNTSAGEADRSGVGESALGNFLKRSVVLRLEERNRSCTPPRTSAEIDQTHPGIMEVVAAEQKVKE